MLSTIKRARIVFAFFAERFHDYAQLTRLDMSTFRHEFIRAIFGVCVCAASAVALVCFICIAVLVTNWETRYRIVTAWSICAVWALLAVGGTWYARHAVKHSSPFANIGQEIGRDLTTIKENSYDHAHDPETG